MTFDPEYKRQPIQFTILRGRKLTIDGVRYSVWEYLNPSGSSTLQTRHGNFILAPREKVEEAHWVEIQREEKRRAVNRKRRAAQKERKQSLNVAREEIERATANAIRRRLIK